MANHASHSALPFPVKNARYSIQIPYLDADGDPTDPTTPDTEVSKDAGAFADCAEEVTTISGSNGMGYITLSGAETDCSMLALAAKVASGPKNTLATLYPRVLPILENGTAQAGAAGSITLAAAAAAYGLTGCIVRTTGGTGGGGTGGANNQARVITAYNTGTKVATVVPNWETNPSSDTTYDILVTEMAVTALIANITAINGNENAAIRQALASGAIEIGTVDTATFTPTNQAFEADDITEATADHYNGALIVWTGGALLGQRCLVKDYELANSKGKFTVLRADGGTLTEAPANNDTFILV